ncbi:MAG: hypothetical protein FJ386_00020 [Verrucomicrobia bacterium]|nr:hypothetical protein [Verrucomicrobiota bacterium]
MTNPTPATAPAVLNPTLETVRQFLAGSSLIHHVEGGGEALSVRMVLSHVTVNLFYQVTQPRELLELICRVPVSIPPARRAAVVEFLMRVNFILRNARFLLDYSDGEVSLRMSAEIVETPPTEGQLACWLFSACTVVDGFFPALMAVTFARMNPAQAVEQGEAAYEELLQAKKSDEPETE